RRRHDRQHDPVGARPAADAGHRRRLPPDPPGAHPGDRAAVPAGLHAGDPGHRGQPHRARLRRGGPQPWRVPGAHHRAGTAAEHRRGARHLRRAGPSRRHAGRRRPQLPRLRRSAAHAELGADDRSGPAAAQRRPLAGDHPLHRLRDHYLRALFRWGLAACEARRARHGQRLSEAADRAGRRPRRRGTIINKDNDIPGPLAGLRVLDFGQYVAGPLTAVLLADQGADVIHVDPPGGPRWPCVADAFFNRGKRRVILDLKKPDELAAARRLAAAADVVIENFRPGVLARLGLDLDAARQANPALITCSLPGFGAGDPRAGMRAYEGVIAAATANCEPRTGEEPPGWDWSRPTYSALPFASSFAGYLAAVSVVMALIARRRTGRGQRVEVPLFDAMFTLIGHSGAYADAAGVHPPKPIHGRGAGAFRCRDGRY